MITYFINPNILIKEFNEIILPAEKKCFLTVGIEIQKEEIETLNIYINNLTEQKKKFIQDKWVNEANLLYCMITVVETIKSELQMLINLKEDKMAEAWGSLVNAQIILGTVIRNYPFDYSHLEKHLEKLHNYEKLLFPKMIFQSVGGFVKQSHCSICKEDYGSCDHLKGKLYAGEICCRNITEMDLEEVSIVENPANKHCRVLVIDKIDILTLRKV